MHIIEMKDAIKALFGEGTESEFFNYFTLRFPRLLMHCYNAVEVEARHLLPEYFPLIPEPSGAVKGPGLKANEAFTQTPGIDLEGSKMIIRCIEVTTFPESKVHFEFLELKYIYYLFVERNKSFPNFLQRNGSNVTQLEFSSGSLKFESVNKILEKLPNLKKIQFDDVAYEASRTKQTIQPAICQNLVELVIESLNSSNLLQVFQECHTVKKLTVVYITITLEEILQKYPRVQELTVNLNYVYPVNHSNESKIGIHQLKVLKFELRTRDEMILEKLLTFIQKQKTLHQFSFDSDHHSPSQSFCKHLAAHICKLGRLNTLEIRGEHLLEEVEAFLEGSSQVANTRLEELACQLNHIRSLPSSFFGHFTSLRKLDIYCYKVNEIKVYENFITFMNQTKLAVIKLRGLPLATFQCFKHLQVKTLLVLDVSIDNELEDKVPVFEILQECLPNNPNITNFKIDFYKDCDESKSELVPMIVKSLAKLKSLQVLKYSQITPEIIKQIVPLKSLKFWEINDYKSETFYKP